MMAPVEDKFREIYEYNRSILNEVSQNFQQFPALMQQRRLRGLAKAIARWQVQTEAKLKHPKFNISFYEECFLDAYELIYRKYLALDLIEYFTWVQKAFAHITDTAILNCLFTTWFTINTLQWWWYQLSQKLDYEVLADFTPIFAVTLRALRCCLENSFYTIQLEDATDVKADPAFQKLLKTTSQMQAILQKQFTLQNFNHLLTMGENLAPDQSLVTIAQTANSPAFYSLIVHRDLQIFAPIVQLAFRLHQSEAT